MIKVFSTQYLAEKPENKNDIFVITVKETFFLGIKIKHEEHCNYDLSLIDRYKPMVQPKNVNKIGYKPNNKKKRKNENKSKVSQS